MLPDKRKAMLTVILGKMVPKGGASTDACKECGKDPCECGDIGRETAMDELISAFRAGDAKKALVAWDAVCEMAPGSDECAPERKTPTYPQDDEDDDE